MYYLIFLAVAKHNNGDGLEAQRYLKEALDIALPDGVYLPFADHECIVALLSELNMCHFSEGNLSRPPYGEVPENPTAPLVGGGGSDFAALLSLCKRQANGVSIIRKALLQNKSPLTPREREVALLAKKRRSAKEIAAELYISEKTVNTILRNVYSKLDIHSKNDLLYKKF